MAKTNPAAHVRVIEETPAYWRVVFEYPPFNIVDATIFEGLQDLVVDTWCCQCCSGPESTALRSSMLSILRKNGQNRSGARFTTSKGAC